MSYYRKSPYLKRYVWTNIKWYARELINAPKRTRELKKKGYTYETLWAIDSWFLEIMPKILKEFREKTHSYPYKLTPEQWDKILSDMEQYLYKMSEEYYDRDKMEYKEIDRQRMAAKEKFFELFSEYFYDLWD